MSAHSDRPRSPKLIRRQSCRIKKQLSKPALPTPRASPSPSRVPTPITTSSQNRRRTKPATAMYTTTTAGTSASTSPPTVNWDCVSYVVSDQKIQSSYDKPTLASGTTQVSSYGRVVTTTTTTTVTTTIATTEILRPGEEGYEASVARQAAQAAASPEEQQRVEKRFGESRLWSAGHDGGVHEAFHRGHHRCAEAVFTSA